MMRVLIIFGLLLCTAHSVAFAQWQFAGKVEGEWRYFFQDRKTEETRQSFASAAIQPEVYYDFESGRDSLTLIPFLRVDQHDAERTHADIREAHWLHARDQWELKLGIGKEYWGVTEFLHLVDIINQTDGVEGLDGEDKLGQPMAKLTLLREIGTFEFYVLPGFREQTFAGREGRLRGGWVVDTDDVRYESAARSHHTDGALRYSHSIGDYDIGVGAFHGTARAPVFLVDTSGQRLIPLYEQQTRFSVDTVAAKGDWLIKLEAATWHQSHQQQTALTGGVEYTWVGLIMQEQDLGLLAELSKDDRNDAAGTPFENDVFLGARWVLNDIQSTELLAGLSYDLNHGEKTLGIEGQRRLTDFWQLEIEGRFFIDTESFSPLSALQRDDFLGINLSYQW